MIPRVRYFFNWGGLKGVLKKMGVFDGSQVQKRGLLLVKTWLICGCFVVARNVPTFENKSVEIAGWSAQVGSKA